MSKTAKMSARDRVLNLVDANSFVEIGAMVTARNTDFNLQDQALPADGVITGYGVIDSSIVYVYSQDVTAMKGAVGEMHAKKIANLYRMAVKVGAPVIGLVDCAGIRLQEATDALAGFGEIYLEQAKASGVIPQVTAILGSCGGGVAISSVMSDFVFMEKNDGKLFVNSPNVVDGNYIDRLNTSDADFQSETANVSFVCDSEAEVFEGIRKVLAMLPANNENDAFVEDVQDDLNRMVPEFATDLKDAAKALADLADQKEFIEVKKNYGKSVVTGLMTLNGMTIGCVANQVNEQGEGVLTTEGALKAEEFVNFCDAFSIPVLTLTNVKGYGASLAEEKTVALAAGKLTFAFANASVPKVNVICGNAFGSAYVTMNSKHIGADMVFALPNAKIGMMDAAIAAEIMYGEANEEKAKEYDELQTSVDAAAKRGYVDAVIAPEEVRKNLIYSFEMLYTKREVSPSKKHGTK